jgi:lysine 2,3-aminomutase
MISEGRAGLRSPIAPALEEVAARYAVAITPAISKLIDPQRPRRSDRPAIRARCGRAGRSTPEERADPIGDHAHSPVEGIVHRYPDRVLLKAVHVCPVYCRFCFRREMVGPQGARHADPERWTAPIDYIAGIRRSGR